MNAIIYARYSSDNQREESNEGQIRECKEYAQKNGMRIIKIYADKAISAKTDSRPQFQQMIKDSEKKLFEVVLIWKIDRFARNRYDSATYKARLKKHGVKVVSAKEISEGPEGIILEAMLEGYAEYYSAELSQKVIRGRTENALKCKHNGGYVTYGYQTNAEQKFEINPMTAPIVKEIFTRYDSGESIKNIAKDLNNRGIVSGIKSKFDTHKLPRILKNRRYIGEYRDILIEDGIPVIIDKDMFDRIQKRLEENKHAPAKSKAKVEYLLSTKLFCGKCGYGMVADSGTSKTGGVHYYYKCSGNKRFHICNKKAVKKDWVERFVVENVVNNVLRDDVIDKIADDVVAIQKRENITIPLLNKQLSEVKKSIDNILKAIEMGIITDSTKQRLEDLESMQADISIKLAQEQIQKPLISKDHVVFWISKFKDGDIESPEYRKKIIDIFVNSVFLYDDRMVITCNYKDGTKTISFGDIAGSDLPAPSPPFKTDDLDTQPQLPETSGFFGSLAQFF